MKTIQQYEELENALKSGPCLIYVHTNHCGICLADLPRVEELAKKHNFPMFVIDPAEMPILRGQWSLFTVPAVLLFLEGKEMHRQARIIDFKELEYRMVQLKEAFN